MGALDGLLVVSLEQAVAAPFVSSRLADAVLECLKLNVLKAILPVIMTMLSTDSLPILSGSIEEKSRFQWI